MEVLMIINIILGILGSILKGIIGVVKFGANVAYKGALAVGKTARFLYKAGKSTQPRIHHEESKHTSDATRLNIFK